MNTSNQIPFIITFPIIVFFGFFYYRIYYKDHESMYAEMLKVITFGAIKPKISAKIFLVQNILLGFVSLLLYLYTLYVFLVSPK